MWGELGRGRERWYNGCEMVKRKLRMVHKRRGVKMSSFRLKLKTSTILAIGQVLAWVVAVILMVSFSRQGVWLYELNMMLLGVFGLAGILVPFIFIVAGLSISKLKLPIGEPNVLVGGLLLLLSLSGLFRQGSIGGAIWLSVATLVTGIGAVVLLAGAIAVSLIVLFKTSIDQVVTLFLTGIRVVGGFVTGQKDTAVDFGGRAIKVSGMTRGEEPVKEGEVKEGRKEVQKSVTVPAAVVAKSRMSKDGQLVSNLPEEVKVWEYPPVSILTGGQGGRADRGDVKGNAAVIERTLESFGIRARVAEVNLGPAVTQYALEVALGTKLSKITNLSNDLALALAAPTGQIRIEAPIPGRSLVGIELPNRSPEFVPLKEILNSEAMKKVESKLAVALGLNVAGEAVVADIDRMPHVLIAGQTGSGKSVCINAFIASILFRASPAEVKMIMVDPKRVELTGYNGIPHLLTPVIVEPDKVLSALKWAITEMDRRYKLFAQVGARNIAFYNEMAGFQALPYILIFVDELADIMLFAPAEVEDTITRLAQMSRATGIHMVVSTQRPSVDIITGLIKANIPCRIAFAVASGVDSRVIIDGPGAEKLLGRGDMLYIPPDQAKPTRIQGAYISDGEVNKLIEFLRRSGVKPDYEEEVTSQPVKRSGGGGGMAGDGSDDIDPLFEESVRVVCNHERASASLLQRRLSIGYARAARILDQLEAAGIVGPAEGSKPRDVLVQNPDEAFDRRSAS